MSDQDIAVARPERLTTDYLIVGAGAMGMAFADEIFTAHPQARITLVDRRARPGGHWVDSYPYVALHQPAAFYGLNSANLGTGGEDLASGPEIQGYYHRVMQSWLASGRVQFFSSSEFREAEDGSAELVSLLDENRVTRVEVRERLVDASYHDVQVPATHGPRFEVEDGVSLVPPNGLPGIREPWARYMIIGAGKTGMDAILFLLDRGVEPDRIHWITPNTAWLWDRPSIQPGTATAMFVEQLDAIIEHQQVDQTFMALEQTGGIHRIDRDDIPTKWRCATVHPDEVAALRRVRQVIRLGRVKRLGRDEITLENGSVPTDARTLHIDCTANGLAKKPVKPLFEPGRVTLQSIFMCQQVLSAAIIARMLKLDMSDAERNALCRVIPHPELKEDMAPCLVYSVENLLALNRHMALWIRRSRLSFLNHDSLWDYLINAWKVKKRLPAALAALEKMRSAA